MLSLSSRVSAFVTRQHSLVPAIRCFSSSSSGGNSSGNKGNHKSTFSPPRRPSKIYQSRHQPKPLKRVQTKGPREPFDISRPVPKIDFSNIPVTETEGDDDDVDDLDAFGPIMKAALLKARHDGGTDLDAETYLKMMDYFTSAPGSTEDLVGERRILALESWDGTDRKAIQEEIDRLVHQERLDYMELPKSDIPDLAVMEQASRGGSTRVPANQLAHGAW